MAKLQHLLPRSRVIKVEFMVALPFHATKEEVLEWVRSELGCGAMAGDNVLGDYDVEAIAEPVLHDTGMHMHERVEPLDGGAYRTYKHFEAAPYTGPPAQAQIYQMQDTKRRRGAG